MNIQEQVNYWRKSSNEDFAAAESLLEKGHLRHCLFFSHLAIEKMIKAIVTFETRDIPPRIHNLVRLAERAGLVLNPEQENFLREFGVYQLQGRYPDSEQVELSRNFVDKELVRAQEMLKWLTSQLS
jgi:HEPN domain-containing protein